METITSKTKKYITSIIITLVMLFVILLILTIYLIKMDIISTLKLSHVFLISIIILIFIYLISIIIKRIKKNEIEKQFKAKYFQKYEETKDMLKYSCLSRNEKKIAYNHIQTLFTNIQNQQSENNNNETFDPKKYATNYIASIGYKRPIPLIFNVMDRIFMSLIILILLQLWSLLITNYNIGFYEVTLLPFNIIFVFAVTFIAGPLHNYMLKNNKPIVAGLVPFIVVIIYIGLFLGLNALSNNNLVNRQIIIYIISGNFMFIRTTLRLVLFIVAFAMYFLIKTFTRKSCVKKLN